MANNKRTISVTTTDGHTFTRTTARDYRYIVAAFAFTEAYKVRRRVFNLPEEFGAPLASWCSRFDLATKQAAKDADLYSDIRIYDVATGARIR